MARSNTAENSEPALTQPSSENFFALGMQCSIGGDAPADLVSAHKWFNLAAMAGNNMAGNNFGGNEDAIRLRREIAEQMSNAEIGTAQRAARDYIKQHPERFAPLAPRLHAAA